MKKTVFFKNKKHRLKKKTVIFFQTLWIRDLITWVIYLFVWWWIFWNYSRGTSRCIGWDDNDSLSVRIQHLMTTKKHDFAIMHLQTKDSEYIIIMQRKSQMVARHKTKKGENNSSSWRSSELVLYLNKLKYK